MLIILKERFAPTNQFRELKLREQYRKIQRIPQSQSVETWLQQWERIVARCIQQKLPETEGVRPQRDFLRAIHGQYAEFVVPIIRDLEDAEETLLQARASSTQQPTVSKKLKLQRILQQFRNYLQFASSQRKGSAFAATL
jgi:hypothetical protein